MRNDRAALIRRGFLDIDDAVGHLSHEDILNRPAHEFEFHFQRLQQLIAEDVDKESITALLGDNDFLRVARRLSRLKTSNGLKMEIAFAKSVAAADDPWERLEKFPYYKNYLELAGMEFQGACLAPEDRVVFLGSGPMPLSLICLYTQFGVRGIGIEKEAAYAGLSREVLSSLGLNAHIRIIHGDHFSLPLDAALVMVGADAVPKDEIFAHLGRSLPGNARISYRIYEKGLRQFMERLSSFRVPGNIEEYRRIRPVPPVQNTSVFLVKKGEPPK